MGNSKNSFVVGLRVDKIKPGFRVLQVVTEAKIVRIYRRRYKNWRFVARGAGGRRIGWTTERAPLSLRSPAVALVPKHEFIPRANKMRSTPTWLLHEFQNHLV